MIPPSRELEGLETPPSHPVTVQRYTIKLDKIALTNKSGSPFDRGLRYVWAPDLDTLLGLLQPDNRSCSPDKSLSFIKLLARDAGNIQDVESVESV